MIELNMAKFNVKNPQTGEFEPLDGASQAKVQSDWNQTDNSAEDFIKNKPTIPAAQVNSDWTATSGVAQILNKPTLATVATSGSYNDLSDKPTIPEGVVVDQVYYASSTNAQSGVAVAQAFAKKPGEITTGKRYTIDDETVIAGTGAEAFNDLNGNKASGQYSHAEGLHTTASGMSSHVEGWGTTAPGIAGHAEGSSTTASGDTSHSEGNGTVASGGCSHAEGSGTKASSAYQHVQGKYNVEDANNTYAFIIGNGTADNTRHDAFAIDWNGLIYVNGASTGVDVAALAAAIGDINTVLEEVL